MKTGEEFFDECYDRKHDRPCPSCNEIMAPVYNDWCDLLGWICVPCDNPSLAPMFHMTVEATLTPEARKRQEYSLTYEYAVKQAEQESRRDDEELFDKCYDPKHDQPCPDCGETMRPVYNYWCDLLGRICKPCGRPAGANDG